MTRASGADLRRRFEESYPYALDPFQREAMDLLDRGHSVLVTAPTGSGKTVVAEYAVHLGLASGVRTFYTTPLKALSNQKYGDLVRRHSERNVGLLTGDNSVNPGAPVVVMTTEVLRNMIHAERSALAELGYVVLDEVHFLEDPYRGGVWEEVILGAGPEVRLVCLSATVANADELADWIARVRGETGIVKASGRPVALHNLFAIGDRHLDEVQLLPVFVRGRPNERAAALDALLTRRGTARRGARPSAARGRARAFRPRRGEVVERLARASLLPAIYFIFSRAGCDAAVDQCMADGLRLTSPQERERIREIADSHVEALSDEDLRVLGYGRFLAALESGIAPHHAGMVPPFREAVEEAFAGALVKAVFATETLALGINMPARSVVIEELSKYDGTGHHELTPGEYTQLTGRAGRRGLDEVGYAVVLASPFHGFEDVARLAAAPGRSLVSSFRPTYNLAVSLVRRFEREEAYRVVTSSFAQYLADEDLGEQLTMVLELLEARGYLSGWSVTPAGQVLAGLYHEADLLVAESLLKGDLDGLGPAALAAVVSGYTFESRREQEPAPAPPAGAVGERLAALCELSEELGADERARGLPPTRGVEVGFARLARDWARGRELKDVLARQGPARASRPSGRGRHAPARQPRTMTGGDFVRNVKQLADLLGQIAAVAPSGETRESAGRAARRLLRGVVAASSQVTVGQAAGEPGGEPAVAAEGEGEPGTRPPRDAPAEQGGTIHARRRRAS